MTEEWRSVSSFEGIYSISNLGRLRRDKADRGSVVGRILKPKTNSANGYNYYILSLKCKKITFSVHKLVCAAFIGPRPPGYEINHKDGIKTNNALSNLEYVTPKQNCAHACENGLIKQSKKVIRSDGQIFVSAREASRKSGLCRSHVSLVCRGGAKTAKGYSFAYLD